MDGSQPLDPIVSLPCGGGTGRGVKDRHSGRQPEDEYEPTGKGHGTMKFHSPAKTISGRESLADEVAGMPTWWPRGGDISRSAGAQSFACQVVTAGQTRRRQAGSCWSSAPAGTTAQVRRRAKARRGLRRVRAARHGSFQPSARLEVGTIRRREPRHDGAGGELASDEHNGIIELPEDAPIGMSFADYRGGASSW